MESLLFEKEGGGALPQRVLRHVERYRITTPHAVQRLFFAHEEKASSTLEQAQELLDDLAADGNLLRLRARKGANQGDSLSFERSVYLHPEHKIKPVTDLARLWFCCLSKVRRYYATHDEIKPLFASEGILPPYHNFFHALSEEEGGTVLYRLYVCQAERKSAGQQIRSILNKYAKSFQHWIDEGSYGVAILVQSVQKKKEIEGLINESYAGQRSLYERARFLVSFVPSEADYPVAIRRYESEAWQ